MTLTMPSIQGVLRIDSPWKCSVVSSSSSMFMRCTTSTSPRVTVRIGPGLVPLITINFLS